MRDVIFQPLLIVLLRFAHVLDAGGPIPQIDFVSSVDTKSPISIFIAALSLEQVVRSVRLPRRPLSHAHAAALVGVVGAAAAAASSLGALVDSTGASAAIMASATI